VLFGTEPDAVVQGRIPPDRLAEHGERALARLQLTGDHFHERRLASAVRSEQARDARRNRDRHVVQADDLAVPLGYLIGGDDGRHQETTSTPRTRRSRIRPDTPMSATIMNRDNGHGVSYLSGNRKIRLPICVRLAPSE